MEEHAHQWTEENVELANIPLAEVGDRCEVEEEVEDDGSEDCQDVECLSSMELEQLV